MGGSRSHHRLAARLQMNAPKEERFPQFCGRVLHRSAMDAGSVAGPLRVDAVEKGLATVGNAHRRGRRGNKRRGAMRVRALVVAAGLSWPCSSFSQTPEQPLHFAFKSGNEHCGDFRFWHKADMAIALSNVRFRGQSGHHLHAPQCLLLAQSAHPDRAEPCRLSIRVVAPLGMRAGWRYELCVPVTEAAQAAGRRHALRVADKSTIRPSARTAPAIDCAPRIVLRVGWRHKRHCSGEKSKYRQR